MENTVTMSLQDYDRIKDRARDYEQAAKDAAREMASLKIFKVTKNYNGNLEVRLTDDAKQFLDKAFSEYASEYKLKPLDDLYIWDCAKPVTQKESTPDAF